MEKIVDYKCTYDNAAGIDERAIKKLNLVFPDAYKHGDTMALIAKELKDFEKMNFCELPFDHTVEGEAMGGHVNFGDEKVGPRAKDYICTSPEEILELPDIDFTKGRIKEVLEAGKKLRSEGENVVLDVSGPFTILNVLLDVKYVFKGMRKNPEVMDKVFKKLNINILNYIKAAQDAGINMISYADSAGGLNIIGPKMAEQIACEVTYPLLKQVEEVLNDKTMVVLCPKTSLALIGTEKAQWEEVEMPEVMTYGEAVPKVIGKVKFVGQTCIKNVSFELKDKVFKGIKLV